MNDLALGLRHQRVQRLRRLLRQRSVRRSERAFVVEGAKVLGEALSAGAVVEAIFTAPGSEQSAASAAVLERAHALGVRVFPLREGVIERVADTVSPQPLIAIVGCVDVPLVEVTETPLLVVCAEVRDPGNLGSIIRSADAAGSAGIVLSGGTGDLYNPKVVRASAGSLFHLPVVLGGDVGAILTALGDAGYRRYATTATGGVDYGRAEYPEKVAIVLGNEANGLGEELLDACDARLSIPIAGAAESLNVAMAATVLVFDVSRRRREQGAPGPSMTQ